ncbi:hypothetical protein E2C01_066188 [Portunus trituberculatus]|uniref:Uncharacterized protein n=1 Tax=Portunus trituberculatus TaxID=210409 RepID=A0A5B7HRM0_PORTR|nr:hypothetical protein [Portunus trituberculatus]
MFSHLLPRPSDATLAAGFQEQPGVYSKKHESSLFCSIFFIILLLFSWLLSEGEGKLHQFPPVAALCRPHSRQIVLYIVDVEVIVSWEFAYWLNIPVLLFFSFLKRTGLHSVGSIAGASCDTESGVPLPPSSFSRDKHKHSEAK